MEKFAGFEPARRDRLVKKQVHAATRHASSGKENLNGLFPGLLLIAMAMPVPAMARLPNISELSIEQLMDIQVTSVAKKPQKISESAAAIYVITQEDIRRSGMNSIPELLRMVPGLDVAQIDANKWAVSSRGFNDRFANNLLVLIDGRSVYSPTFAGTYWDSQDTVLEDIERIEVIRGPGGTLWGANAVNGVVNVITKKAADTQGGLVTAGAGNFEKANATIRYGGKINESDYFRIYAKGFSRDAYGAHDAWNAKQAGFRADLTLSGNDTLMFDGHLREGSSDSSQILTTLTPPSNLALPDTNNNRDGHAMVRWERRLADKSDMSLQGYFDSVERSDIVIGQKLDTWDIDFQHRFSTGSSQEIIWGLGYRRIDDQYRNSFTVTLNPAQRSTEVYSAFIQDEIALRNNLRLIVGSKFEHNSYTGFEVQPNARLLFEVAPNQTFWGALSRAVQTPSRAYSDIRINVAAFPGSPPSLVAINGNPALQPQEVLATEIGYRNQLTAKLNLDMTAFYNRYKNLITNEPGKPAVEALPPPAHLLIPAQIQNMMNGETHGVEIGAKWQALPNWRLGMGYAWLNTQMNLDPASHSPTRLLAVIGNSPAQQFQLKSWLNLSEKLDLDVFLYFVDSLHVANLATPVPIGIPGYTRLDLRVGYRPAKNMELSLAGQNLLDKRHQEFSTYDVNTGTIPRSIYGKIVWRF